MTTVGKVYDVLNELAPFALAESWDNSGLLVGAPNQPVYRVLLALDATDAVIQEAADQGAQLIVTHHPVIFSPLKRLGPDSPVYHLVRHSISVISAHTNLDIAEGGVNDVLAHRLDLTGITGLKQVGGAPFYKVVLTVPTEDSNRVYEAMVGAGAGMLGNYSSCAFLMKGEGRFQPLAGANPAIGTVDRLETVEEIRLEMLVAPHHLEDVLESMKQAHPYEEPAFDVFENHACEQQNWLGRVGDLISPITPDALAALVKKRLGAGGIRYVPGCSEIRRVAVCGGSGAELLEDAKAAGAQALITGESKHHLFLEAAKMGVTLIDAGHFTTETVVLEPLRKQMEDMLPGVAIRIAASNGDGVRYI